jgi:hypothetical protein
MIISTVVDPNAFDEKQIKNQDFLLHAVSLLEGLDTNGIMLVDSQERLKNNLIDKINNLPTSKGQWIQIQLAEFLKKRNRIIKCREDGIDKLSNLSIPELICKIKNICRVDAAIVSDTDRIRYNHETDKKTLVPISDYRNSELERKRKWLFYGVPPIDQLSNVEFKNIIIRIVKFAKWIKIYDKQIGKGQRTKQWLKAIDFILRCWKLQGHFASDNQAMVEIYTCEADRIPEHEIEFRKAKRVKRNEITANGVRKDILKPLQKKYPWPIKMYFKRDSEHNFHARHLQTQSAVILFDRGFDLFEKNGKRKRNIIKLDNPAISHLKEFKNSPNVL